MDTSVNIRARLIDFSTTSTLSALNFRYIEDALLVVEEGIIRYSGEFNETKANGNYLDYRPFLLSAGFIDLHLHLPQLQILGSHADGLLDWLARHTFPNELAFSEQAHADEMAGRLINRLIDHGTTTAVAFGSSHKGSISAYFEEALSRNMCMIGGKTMMDRGAPQALCDTAQSSYDDSKFLIEKYHKFDRLSYAIAPRFAITSSPEQLKAAQALRNEFPDCYVQTHINENDQEIIETAHLYPEHEDYLGIYEHYDLVDERTLLGHAIHMKPREIASLIERKAIAVHCPTSNLFLGSGLMPWKEYIEKNISTGLATDIGGGTSFSMLKTMDEAFKIAQLKKRAIDPLALHFQATMGNAKALGLEAEIGGLAVGSVADFILLNPQATEDMALRYERIEELTQEIFMYQILGDDRAIAATYIAGKKQ